MFCSHCGEECINQGAKFCSHCGLLLENTSFVERPSLTLGFEEFKKRKEVDRRTHFEPKLKLVKTSKPSPKAKGKSSDVKINVGFMKYENGTLKKCRGKTYPICVPATGNAAVIKNKAVRKHANHDKKICEGLDYTLLYPDGSQVVFVPGTSDPFTLEKYREDIGKNYNRITLYICIQSEFLLSELPEGLEDEDIESEHEFEDDSIFEKSVFDFEERANSGASTSRGQGGPSTSLGQGGPSTSLGQGGPSTSLGQGGPSTSLGQGGPRTSHGQGQGGLGTSGGSVAVIDINDTGDGPAGTGGGRERAEDPMAECPTCFIRFPVRTIADHADACCDIWVGEIEETTEAATDASLHKDDVLVDLDSVEDIHLTSVLACLTQNMQNQKSFKLRVRRKDLWADVQVKLKQGKLAPDVPLKIDFIGEPAVDDGGPRREFFSEMLDIIQRKLFVEGKPIASTIALINDDFLLAGVLMVMSVLQGGPAPSFLHHNVFLYLTSQSLCADENDGKYKDAANKIQSVTDEKELQSVLLSDEVLDILEEIGYSGVPSRETLTSSANIVQSICTKSQMYSFMPQLMQLQQGLGKCGVLASAIKYPNLWEPVFSSSHTSSATTAEDYLDGLIVNFSTSQIDKEKEIDVYKIFSDYLESLDEGGDIKINDIMKWLSGSPTVPVLGFNKKFSLSFVHGCRPGCHCRPTASTCDLLIKLPVHIHSTEEMGTIMASALNDCTGFGFI